MTATGPSNPRRAGSLQPVELAQASVMAALCAATAIIAVVVPFAAGLSLLGTVPMGLLAYRYRLRVLLAATVAGGIIAFLIAGMGGFMTVINCAYIGGLAGIVKHRGRGTPTVFFASLVAGAAFGVASVAWLTIFARLRNLIFDSMTANINGLAAVIARIPDMEGVAERLKHDFATALDYWPYLFFGISVLSITIVSLIGWWALSRVMARLLGIPDVHKLESSTDAAPIAPVPARLRDVRFRYPTADHDALNPVSLNIDPGEHLAVTGPNGSGKTTLMLVLAGREPTSGTVERPGAVGLGRLGGTAVVMQHPESQVLGTRVADDVVWGLPPGQTTDVHRLLTEVGLDGLAERDTGGLSGGELQRLAVAGALAREPSLLIADEVTSMVDQDGRDGLMSVLSGLTQRHRMSLVHITHYNDEADAADRTVDLTGNGGGADNTDMVETAAAPTATVPMGHHPDAPVLELNVVGHEYGSGTPWATTALRDITFAVNEGDGCADPRPERVGQVDAGVDHGGAGRADGRHLPARRQTGIRSGRCGGNLVSGVAAAADAQPRRPGSRVCGRFLGERPRSGGRLAGDGRPRPGAGEATHRSAQRRPDAPRRARRAAGTLTSRDHPRRAAGRSGCREPAWAAAAAGRPAAPRRIDRRRHLARLLGPGGSVPAHAAPAGRGAGSHADSRGRHVMTAPTAARRPRKSVVLLRPVPGRTVIHELWAGTKLLVVAGIGVLMTFYPGWVPIGMVAALVLTAAWLARIPRGALPSIPRWLWVLLILGGVTATFAGGSPVVDLGPIDVGLGGLFNFLRITALSIVLLGLGAMVSWTTNVAEIAPAVATLGRPLRKLRIPVDDWAVTLALALRAFPMLIDEFRVLYAARRLRPREVPTTRRARRRRWALEVIDLLAATITVALRRADEMGDAITARGGAGQISAAPSRPRRADWIALAFVLVVFGTALALELTLLGTS